MAGHEILAGARRRRRRRARLAAACGAQPGAGVARRSTLDHRPTALFERMNGLGAHEVVIETPRARRDLGDDAGRRDSRWCSGPGATGWPTCARLRLRPPGLQERGRQGRARLAHPHSQVVAMPVVPQQLAEEVAGARRASQRPARCVFCALIEQELAAGTRVVTTTAAVMVLAPFAARVPFETWLLPRAHHARIRAGAGRCAAASARERLRTRCSRLDLALEPPPHTVLLHTARWGRPDARLSLAPRRSSRG